MQLLHLIEEFEFSFCQYLHALTDSQLKNKKNENSWNVLEIIEHINIVDENRIVEIEAATKNAEFIDTEHIHHNIKDLAEKTKSRTEFIQTPVYAEPKGIYADLAQALKEFKTIRKKYKTFLENKEIKNLRSIVLPHRRLGNMNIEEWIVYLNAHAQRHFLQIIETAELK